jgi:hypothetical protein
MDELVRVCEGKQFRVSLTKEVAAQFEKIDARERARCLKWMRLYAEDGHTLLDNEKLKNEGKFPVGDKAGSQVTVLAFKVWQVRVYGGVVDGNHFIGTEIDTSKKTNKADMDALRRAAKKLASYLTLGKKK